MNPYELSDQAAFLARVSDTRDSSEAYCYLVVGEVMLGRLPHGKYFWKAPAGYNSFANGIYLITNVTGEFR